MYSDRMVTAFPWLAGAVQAEDAGDLRRKLGIGLFHLAQAVGLTGKGDYRVFAFTVSQFLEDGHRRRQAILRTGGGPNLFRSGGQDTFGPQRIFTVEINHHGTVNLLVLQQVEQQGGHHSTAGARPPDLRVGRMGNKEIFCMPLQIKDIKFPAEHPPGESWKIHICPRTGCRARSAAGTLSGKDRVPRLVKLYYPYRTNSRAYHATYAQTFLNDIVTQLDIAHIQPLPSPGAIFYFVQNAAVSILQCSRHLWLPKQWAIRLGAGVHLSGTHFTIKNQVFIDLQLKKFTALSA